MLDKPIYYQRYVAIYLYISNHLINYYFLKSNLNSFDSNKSLNIENEKTQQNVIIKFESFLTVHRKTTFGGTHNHFDSFFLNICEPGTIHK